MTIKIIVCYFYIVGVNKEGVILIDNYTCGALLKQINDIMEKNANNALREQDLTISQSGVLVLLDNEESKTLSFKELEKKFGVAQPTMVGILRRLEQKNLIEVLTDSDDKRIKKAHLTESGVAKCKEGYKHMSMAEELLLSGLSEKEKAEFLRMLIKIRNAME